MKFLRRVLNIAVRDEQLERNPFAKITLPTMKTISKAEATHYTS